MTTTDETYPDEVLAAIKNQLASGYCRLEFSYAFGVKGTYQTVQVYAPGPTPRSKWVKVGPFLTIEENTRPALLRMLADLCPEPE